MSRGSLGAAFCLAALALPACDGSEGEMAGGERGSATLPSSADSVQHANDWCEYQDQKPYVKAVKWQHAQVRQAMSALAHGWRSTFSYGEWKDPYGLEDEDQEPRDAFEKRWLVIGERALIPSPYGGEMPSTIDGVAEQVAEYFAQAECKKQLSETGGDAWDLCLKTERSNQMTAVRTAQSSMGITDMESLRQKIEQWSAKRRNARVRNFIRGLCGEFRDYPEMIRAKLERIIDGQVYAAAGEMRLNPGSSCTAGDVQFCEVNGLSGVKTCAAGGWGSCRDTLFSAITFPAYQKMMNVMQAMHQSRQQRLLAACEADAQCSANTGYTYNFYRIEEGMGPSVCNRVNRSVSPWTHCEMRFMFEKLMVEGAPSMNSYVDPNAPQESYTDPDLGFTFIAQRNTYDNTLTVAPPSYEDWFAAFQAAGKCAPRDREFMYNFRGHKNYKPLWLESNAFIWNSRRGGKVLKNRPERPAGDGYYLRPFASRLLASKKAWATYLFYPAVGADDPATTEVNESYHEYPMAQAAYSGGGPILYLTDQDQDGDNLADYRLFPNHPGCGDGGVSGGACNQVEPELARSTPSTTGHLESWNPAWFDDPDMGFLRALTGNTPDESFSLRMQRFNQALDRHTNWGPTGYYMLDAAKEGASPSQIPFMAAYSPIVACSYDISASNGFASGDYPSTHPYESSQTKWMFVMRFPTANYYDEQDMKEGKAIDFHRNYFNETSLSNDYYRERALDRFGFVPLEDIHANIYFVFGARGESVPPAVEVPPPAN